MIKHLTLSVAAVALSLAPLQAQLAFTNASVTLPHNSHAGACVGVTDMDGDGLDDIVQMDMSTHIYVLYQNTDHTFVSYDYGSVDGSSQWGWAIADLDNDGHKDICSGVSTTRYLHITARGVYTLTNLDGPTIFTQCMTMADWNNDGRVDVFACNDVGPSNIWFTNASGTPVYDAAAMPWATSCTGTSGDMSGNYGSTATDFDNDGDIDLHISHCRQGVNDPNDCRRWDRLFVNDGNGNYSDQAAAYGMENHEQVWTTDFGDIDNDGDLDAFQTTHSSTLMLWENDGTGHFTNITAGSGLQNTSGFFLQAKMEDMDNDGFIDVLTGSAEHFFKGNGDGTFTELTNLFPASKQILSFAFGDLNGDGFQDVYAGYGDGYVDGDAAFPDRLWLNTPNGNHWLNVKLKGVQSNRDAVGARVTITGPWGTMIREVHAGESYGIVNSFILHFGLGSNTTIPTLTIDWPSGQQDVYTNIAADQVIGAIEGTCLSPTASITTPTAPIICGNGDSITLTANAGFNYTWSTGATTQSIDATTPGNYVVTIDDGTGCEGNTSITVLQSPDETPTVVFEGATTFCEGGQLALTSSAASGYTWSNGATDQSINVTTSGTYTVTIEGVCGNFTSDPTVVTVLPAPGLPSASDVSIPVPGTADLTATGSNLNWYDVATGGASLGTGNTFTTPFLWNTSTFYVSAANVYGGGDWYGGATDRLQTATPGAYFNNANNYLFFTATEPFTILSVKVYANGAGNRTINLIERTGGSTVATATINIPDGESRIDLNFAVPAAGDYGLRVASGNPQLWRDALGSNPAYPYALGTVGSITSSSVAGANATAYYYFFYDWEVSAAGTLCESAREPVQVTVLTVGITESSTSRVRVFPNPATDNISIDLASVTGVSKVELMDLTGRTVRTIANAKQGSLLTMDVNSLAAGEYTLRVNHSGGSSMHRVVVQ